MSVKGLEMPAYDPRSVQGIGVTYATSTQGADHTAGLIVNPGMQPDEFAQSSQEVQLVNAVCDSSGFCQFLGPTLDDVTRHAAARAAGPESSRTQAPGLPAARPLVHDVELTEGVKGIPMIGGVEKPMTGELAFNFYQGFANAAQRAGADGI